MPSEESQTTSPRDLLNNVSGARQAPVRAMTYIRKWETSSKPVALMCDDGQTYVVKALQNNNPLMGRVMVTEQVVARIGLLIGAPVSGVALVDVPAALISTQPEMQHLNHGVAHGSKFMAEVTEQMGLEPAHPLNRDRFARLAVLYGWVSASDLQFVYNKVEPRLVHSVDHGHFLVGGPNWTLTSLAQPSIAQLDATVTNACSLTSEEKDNAVRYLFNIDNHAVAEIVSIPPVEWGFADDERVAFLDYLLRRRDQIKSAFPHLGASK
jgi:hypothetical protein